MAVIQHFLNIYFAYELVAWQRSSGEAKTCKKVHSEFL